MFGDQRFRERRRGSRAGPWRWNGPAWVISGSPPPIDLGLPGMCCVIQGGLWGLPQPQVSGRGGPSRSPGQGALEASFPPRSSVCTSYEISVDNRPHFLSTYVPGTVLMVFQISSHRILTSPLDGGLLLLLSPFTHKGIGPER